jgi:hypothetical protein
MKIRDLIEELSRLDPEAEIVSKEGTRRFKNIEIREELCAPYIFNSNVLMGGHGTAKYSEGVWVYTIWHEMPGSRISECDRMS